MPVVALGAIAILVMAVTGMTITTTTGIMAVEIVTIVGSLVVLAIEGSKIT